MPTIGTDGAQTYVPSVGITIPGKRPQSHLDISHEAQTIAHDKALPDFQVSSCFQVFRNQFSPPANRAELPALTTLSNVVFQRPSSTCCMDFRNQAATN